MNNILKFVSLVGATAAFTSTPSSISRPSLYINNDGPNLNTRSKFQHLTSSKLDDPKVKNEPTKRVTSSLASRTIQEDVITNTQQEIIPEWQNLLWKGSIVVLCALWASNFAAAKLIMAEPGVDSSIYTVARFGVAATALLPGAINVARKNLDWETAKGAAICGSWVAFGYIGQTLGLLSTTASKACVICSLNCIFVATLAELSRISKTKSDFDFSRIVPALIAVTGVAIIELKGAGGAPNVGDLLAFAQPIGFGLGYIQLEELMKKSPQNALPVSAIKLVVVSLASLGLFEVNSVINSGILRIPDLTPILSSPAALGGIAYTGLVTTALALWFESVAFKRVPATDVSIILSTEPLFAAGTAALFLGETFGLSDYVGAALIIGACIVATLREDEATEDYCDPYDEKCETKRTWPFIE